VIWSVQSKLGHTINSWVEGIRASVDQGTQVLHEELNVEVEETRLGLSDEDIHQPEDPKLS
jgi:hypothetical protein